MKEFVTPEKWNLFNKIVCDRTRYITVVLEDMFQSHNASAVLRSADCFGVHDVYTIENYNEFVFSKGVALGASKWLNLNRYNGLGNNSLECVNSLKEKGYRIVATMPHLNDSPMYDLDLSKGKIALFFGSEQMGLSDTVLENADEFIYIPMYGFTESFNVSVSAAICMQYYSQKLRESTFEWQLSESEREEVLISWLKQKIKSFESLEKKYMTSL